MDTENIGFQTALFGFKKEDVLACIDKLSAESLEQKKQADERLAELQAQLQTAAMIQAGLQKQVQDDNAALTQLLDQATKQQQRAEAAEADVTRLNQQVTTLESQNQDFKRRLFEREEENVCLRRDNSRLTKECEEKQALLDQQTAQLDELKKSCEARLGEVSQEADARVAAVQAEADSRVRQASQQAQDRMRQADEDARSRVAAAQTAAAREAAETKARMQGSAVQIGRSLNDVKRDLAAVDESITRVTAGLQRSVQELEKALAQAEENVQALGVRMEAFPEKTEPPRQKQPQPARPESAMPKQTAQNPAQPREEASHTAQQARTQTARSGWSAANGPTLTEQAASLSEALLDKLVRILDKK